MDRLTDRRIARAVAGDPDAAPMLDEAWFRSAAPVLPESKVPVSLRLDRVGRRLVQGGGPGYQSRINAIPKGCVAARKGKN